MAKNSWLRKVPGVKWATRRLADAVEPYGPQRGWGGARGFTGNIQPIGGRSSNALAPERPVVWLTEMARQARHDYEAGSPYLLKYLKFISVVTLGGRGLRPTFSRPIMRLWDQHRPDTTRMQSVLQYQQSALLEWELTGEILSEDTGDGFTLRDSQDLWANMFLNDDRIIRDPMTQRPIAYPFQEAGVTVPAERMMAVMNMKAGQYRGRSIVWPALEPLRLLWSLDESYSGAAIGTANSPVYLAMEDDLLTIYVDDDTTEKGIQKMLVSATNVAPGDVKVIHKGHMEYGPIPVSSTLPEFYGTSREALIEEAAAALDLAKETMKGTFSDGVFASLKAAYRENMALIDEKRRIIERVTEPIAMDFVRTLPPMLRREALDAIAQEWQVPVFLPLDENKAAAGHRQYVDMGAISVRQVQREIDVDPELMRAEIQQEKAQAEPEPAPEPEPAEEEGDED